MSHETVFLLLLLLVVVVVVVLVAAVWTVSCLSVLGGGGGGHLLSPASLCSLYSEMMSTMERVAALARDTCACLARPAVLRCWWLENSGCCAAPRSGSACGPRAWQWAGGAAQAGKI